MGVLTGTATIPAPVQATFDRALLRRANPKLHHSRPAMKKSLSQRSGNTMIFRRLSKLPLATSPLVEGQPPAGKALSKTDIQCTIQQYGDYVTLTDMVEATVQHPVLRDANKLLGEQAGETTDALDRDIWAAGSSVFYGGGVAGRANLVTTTERIDTKLLERMIRYLGQQNASMFTEMVESTDKEGTVPIRDCYWAIISPEILYTLDTLAGFIAVEHYQGQTRTQRGEVGAYKNIRFLCTTQAKKWDGGGGTGSGDVKITGGLADVHTILVFGEDAVAQVPLEGMSLQNIIKPLGAGGTSDPLDQIATSGWKSVGARVRLNESFMTRAEVTVADVNP
jgi:N4-gp56 family major capsid protein